MARTTLLLLSILSAAHECSNQKTTSRISDQSDRAGHNSSPIQLATSVSGKRSQTNSLSNHGSDRRSLSKSGLDFRKGDI